MVKSKVTRNILFATGAAILVLAVIYMVPEKKSQFNSEHFVFTFSSNIDTKKIRSLADVLEESYTRVSRDLGVTPAPEIETNVYASWWRYGKATGNWSASGSIEGAAKLHFVEQRWDEGESKKVAIHEFTHAIVLKKLIDQEPQPLDRDAFDKKFETFPVWLWEAVSCYEAGQAHRLKDLPYLGNGVYPDFNELNSRNGKKIYVVGYSLVEFIVQKFGKEKLRELISQYGNLSDVLNLTEEEFLKEWYVFVEGTYLWYGKK